MLEEAPAELQRMPAPDRLGWLRPMRVENWRLQLVLNPFGSLEALPKFCATG